MAAAQRIESVVTSVSWIPSEAIRGLSRVPMDIGLGHYDVAPPEQVDDDVLDQLQADDRLRAANRLAAWIETDGDGITAAGYCGRAVIGSTTGRIGRASITFPGVGYPVLQHDPVIDGSTARFVQSVGCRTGAPFPHRIDRPPYLRVTAPTTWTTLALEIDADGTSRHEVVGAAAFPRHWIYDANGDLAAKNGFTDWADWVKTHEHERSPWHGVERPIVVAAAEPAIERTLSGRVMSMNPDIRTVEDGDTLTVQGESGDELYLVLDGIFSVEVDGEAVAEIGPGAIVGERAVLEGGTRTSTVSAITPARVAAVAVDELTIDPDDLAEVAAGHRREDG
ncbi:MAG: cyclic nucleotide-binding domain-containing protein [Acidimicrobiales bacterium]|nr:cyclic nucleotide-binding domain-containing protein [Acidimicrobiales bacterium]